MESGQWVPPETTVPPFGKEKPAGRTASGFKGPFHATEGPFFVAGSPGARLLS